MKTSGQIEQLHSGLTLFNKWAVPVIALLFLVGAVDLGLAFASVRRPVEPLPPKLSSGPMADLSGFELPAEVFRKAAPDIAASVGSVLVKEKVWKLKGVVSGLDKKAFLEDADGSQSVWVSEGDWIGSYKVRSINERSVDLEMGGEIYEIRM